MYKHAFVLMVVLFSTQSIAAGYSEEDLQKCRAVYDEAELVMTSRQSGAPMADMMEAAGGDERKQDMVEQAYDVPSYNMKQMQENKVLDFAEARYKKCLEGLK